MLRRYTPTLLVPLAETGCISLPTSSQTPRTHSFVWGIQFKIAARAWSPLPDSFQPGSLSLAIHAPTVPHSCCPLAQPHREPGCPAASQPHLFTHHILGNTSGPCWSLPGFSSKQPCNAAAPPKYSNTTGIAGIILGSHDRPKAVEGLQCC